MVFVWHPIRPRKSKQPFQFWLVVEWFSHEILLDHSNRSNLFNFELILNGFSMKSYQIMQIEATCANLTRFWMLLYEILLDHANRSNLFNFDSFLMVFVWNPARPRKSKEPVQIWPVFEWFFYEILQTTKNRSNLFNFEIFLNCFCRKSY